MIHSGTSNKRLIERTTKTILVLLFTSGILSCSEETVEQTTNSEETFTTVTALEGKWKSQCFTGFGNFSSVIDDTSVLSFQIQHIFENSTFDVLFATYSDDTCSTFDKEVDPEASANGVQSFPIPKGFIIGNQFTTIEGNLVTEIDFTFNDGSIKKDIYLLQDNTLYFGLPGTDCFFILTIEEFLTCANIRPELINFNIGYALNGNPVVTPFDSTEPPPGSFSNFDVISITLTVEPLSVPDSPL